MQAGQPTVNSAYTANTNANAYTRNLRQAMNLYSYTKRWPRDKRLKLHQCQLQEKASALLIGRVNMCHAPITF